MKFLILGCNGMAGHMISVYLFEQGYEVEGFAREKSRFVKTIIGDARDTTFLKDTIERGEYRAVVNCIGLLSKFAENDHEAAVYLNSYLPQYLAKITDKTDAIVIHISTDCVFSGSRGGYTENDFPDGELFYDRSKALGELNNKKDVSFRTSIIGPDLKSEGIGLLNWFLQQKGKVRGYKNAIWTGQTTLQLAKTIENAAIQRVHGLYNMVPETTISKYEMLVLFNQYLRKDSIEIIPEENFKIDKSLKRMNYELFSYKIPDYEEQIKELGKWMQEHKNFYPHYDL
ncbi:NAD-dependent epimerase/dehydratase family protein [bacterium 1XD21-13]|nr:NAD-dependent epimerase/dehydratase family protein [bacterium 1XD21-13]